MKKEMSKECLGMAQGVTTMGKKLMGIAKIGLMMICLSVGIMLMTGCSKDDDGWIKTGNELVGIWYSEPMNAADENDVQQYILEVLATEDVHSVQPYQLVEVRKNGQKYRKQEGTIGHPNGKPSNIMVFDDEYGGERYEVEIKWLNSSHTKVRLWRNILFTKRK